MGGEEGLRGGDGFTTSVRRLGEKRKEKIK